MAAIPPNMSGTPLEERVPLTEEQKRWKIISIDRGLRNASLRRSWYRDQGQDRDVQIQDNVIDRLLRERFELMPS